MLNKDQAIETKLKAIEIFHLVLNTLSIFFSVAVAVFACYKRLYQHFQEKLMLAIVLFEIINQLARKLLLIDHEITMARIRTFIMVYFDMARNLTIFFISFNYFDTIKYQSMILQRKRNVAIVWTIVGVFPIFNACLCCFWDSELSCNSVSCVFSWKRHAINYSLLFGALFGALCFSGVTSRFLLQQRKEIGNENSSEEKQLHQLYATFAWKVWIYPSTSTLFLLFVSLNTFVGLAMGLKLEDQAFALRLLNLFFKGITGLVFSLLFIRCDQVYYEAVKSLFQKCCGIKQQRQQQEDSVTDSVLIEAYQIQ